MLILKYIVITMAGDRHRCTVGSVRIRHRPRKRFLRHGQRKPHICRSLHLNKSKGIPFILGVIFTNIWYVYRFFAYTHTIRVAATGGNPRSYCHARALQRTHTHSHTKDTQTELVRTTTRKQRQMLLLTLHRMTVPITNGE